MSQEMKIKVRRLRDKTPAFEELQDQVFYEGDLYGVSILEDGYILIEDDGTEHAQMNLGIVASMGDGTFLLIQMNEEKFKKLIRAFNQAREIFKRKPHELN